jgi:hypothetical protein
MGKDRRLLSNSEELAAYLSEFGIPVWQWGTGTAKEVSHLFREVAEGDSELVEEGGELIRRV